MQNIRSFIAEGMVYLSIIASLFLACGSVVAVGLGWAEIVRWFV